MRFDLTIARRNGPLQPVVIRNALLVGGLVLIAAAWLIPSVRSVLTYGQALSAIIFMMTGLILLPARLWFLTPLFALAVFVLSLLATRLKEAAVELPITYIDVASLLESPEVVLGAVGYHGPVAYVGAFVAALLLVVAVVAVWLGGRRWLTSFSIRVAEGLLFTAIALPMLGLAGRDLKAGLPVRYPEIALNLWDPAWHRQLFRRLGPVEYVSFTHAVARSTWKLPEGGEADLPPATQVREAAERFVSLRRDGPLPNIAILHAESSFDPNLAFRLTKRTDLPLWAPTPRTVSLGPLRVNVIGGGTQVTQFELFTGADMRQFGYWGYYSHLTIAPQLKLAFPSYLANKGYRTVASYPAASRWLGAGKAFKAYGFQEVYFADQLGLRGDWSETDTELVRRAIELGALKPTSSPVFAYFSTLENHGPHPCKNFHSRDELKTSFQAGATFAQDCALNEYLRRAESTSQAMMLLLRELSSLQAITGRPSVLLIYGDHQPWTFTDGNFTEAGGVINTGDTASFAKFRRGETQYITFYHFLASTPGVIPRRFDGPIPVTLLPSLLSAYVARETSDLYLPVNFLIFETCGHDYRQPDCRIKKQAEEWTTVPLFTAPKGSSSDLARGS